MIKDIVIINDKNEYLSSKYEKIFTSEKSEAVKLTYAEAKKIKGEDNYLHLKQV